MSQFNELYELQPDPATANYNLEVLKKFRAIRFNESIAKNPNFFCMLRCVDQLMKHRLTCL